MSVRNRDTRAAQNEDLFRQINERLHSLADLEGGGGESRQQFVCECEQKTCSLVVELTSSEYRAVRTDGTRFLVYPTGAHTSPELETVVERHDRFWVVAKRGEAGIEAELLADRGPTVL